MLNQRFSEHLDLNDSARSTAENEDLGVLVKHMEHGNQFLSITALEWFRTASSSSFHSQSRDAVREFTFLRLFYTINALLLNSITVQFLPCLILTKIRNSGAKPAG
jgi:hypothetical protein